MESAPLMHMLKLNRYHIIQVRKNNFTISWKSPISLSYFYYRPKSIPQLSHVKGPYYFLIEKVVLEPITLFNLLQ